MSVPQRRPANLSLDAKLVAEARKLEIDLSRAAETGIGQAISAERRRRWRLENAEALESSNRWVDANGLPLARHRNF